MSPAFYWDNVYTPYIFSRTFKLDLVVADEFLEGPLELEDGDLAGADGADEPRPEGDQRVDELLLGDDAARAARYAERAQAAAALLHASCRDGDDGNGRMMKSFL